MVWLQSSGPRKTYFKPLGSLFLPRCIRAKGRNTDSLRRKVNPNKRFKKRLRFEINLNLEFEEERRCEEEKKNKKGEWNLKYEWRDNKPKGMYVYVVRRKHWRWCVAIWELKKKIWGRTRTIEIMARGAENSRIWNGYRYRDVERLGRNSFQSFMILKENSRQLLSRRGWA